MTELKYPLFDGEMFWDGAAVTIEDGIITSVALAIRQHAEKA